MLRENMSTLEGRESAVRSYSRSFPAIFDRAKGDWLHATDGRRYLDFLSGAGALNYGHNPDVLNASITEYIRRDGIVHGLDLATAAKFDFIDAFCQLILEPRDLDYRVQFCSPSGTNAIEAALKLARLATGRSTVVAFSGGFHGVSVGSLAATSSSYFRQGLDALLPGVVHVPYPDSPLGGFDSLDALRRMVEDPSSGVEHPAAVLVETVQCEGGVYRLPPGFLRELRTLCDRHGIVLVLDEIQVGCGRTGSFFSFDEENVAPDMVALSKSISGCGLPMALLLIKPALDIWKPGQHSGTFRGNQLAFVAATTALRTFWSDGALAARVRAKGAEVERRLTDDVADPYGLAVRGVGLVWGLDFANAPVATAREVSRVCFERDLVAEVCGRRGEVLKIMPPLTIRSEDLVFGLEVIASAVREVLGEPQIFAGTARSGTEPVPGVGLG